jgi:hypothetical protein
MCLVRINKNKFFFETQKLKHTEKWKNISRHRKLRTSGLMINIFHAWVLKVKKMTSTEFVRKKYYLFILVN